VNPATGSSVRLSTFRLDYLVHKLFYQDELPELKDRGSGFDHPPGIGVSFL